MELASIALDHVALPIYDAAASLQFYEEVLGLPLVSALSGDDWGGRPWLMMNFGLGAGGQLALCALRDAERPPPGDVPNDAHHVAFRVGSSGALEAWKLRLAAHEVQVTEEHHGRQRSLYFEEPNGHVLELTTTSEGADIHDAEARAVAAAWIAGGSRSSGVVPTPAVD